MNPPPNEVKERRGGGAKGGWVRGEEGRGVEEKQGKYWTRDYLLISCFEWIEGVDSIFPPKNSSHLYSYSHLQFFHHFVILDF